MMKDSKKKMVMQELSKEEATNVYGGTKVYINMVVLEGGKIGLVVDRR